MSDYEAFAHLRKPLPAWWMEAEEAERLWNRDGANFYVKKGEQAWPCIVTYSVLERLAGEKKRLGQLQLDQAWREYGDRFKSAALRAVRLKGLRAGTTIRLTMADLMAHDD